MSRHHLSLPARCLMCCSRQKLPIIPSSLHRVERVRRSESSLGRAAGEAVLEALQHAVDGLAAALQACGIRLVILRAVL